MHILFAVAAASLIALLWVVAAIYRHVRRGAPTVSDATLDPQTLLFGSPRSGAPAGLLQPSSAAPRLLTIHPSRLTPDRAPALRPDQKPDLKPDTPSASERTRRPQAKPPGSASISRKVSQTA